MNNYDSSSLLLQLVVAAAVTEMTPNISIKGLALEQKQLLV